MEPVAPVVDPLAGHLKRSRQATDPVLPLQDYHAKTPGGEPESGAESCRTRPEHDEIS